jgi:phosphonate transport system substrate-binding protein
VPRHVVKLVLLAALALALPGTMARSIAAEPKPAIEIAITPFLPVRTLVQNYEPMRVYLEKRLHRHVIFISAPDYRTFAERTQHRDYAYLMTVAHAGYLAETEAGYVPLLRPTNYTEPTLVVAKDDPLVRIADLRGKTIALSDPLAIVSMQALAMLRQGGLDPQRDVALKYLPNHGAAVNHVLSGEAAAAIVSNRALEQMPAAAQAGVRVVHSWHEGAAPGTVYLASPRVPQAEADRFARAVLDFFATAEGRAVMTHLGYGRLVPMKADDLKPYAAYASILKAALTESARP